MIGVFEGVKNHVKREPVSIDNNTFKLHYKVTLTILILCTLTVTAKQYIGDPIDCIVAQLPNNVMDTFCWVHSTFSVPNKKSGILGHEVNHPGVNPLNELGEGEEIQIHQYYQWVWAVLIFQAMLCYVPRYIHIIYSLDILII